MQFTTWLSILFLVSLVELGLGSIFWSTCKDKVDSLNWVWISRNLNSNPEDPDVIFGFVRHSILKFKQSKNNSKKWFSFYWFCQKQRAANHKICVNMYLWSNCVFHQNKPDKVVTISTKNTSPNSFGFYWICGVAI